MKRILFILFVLIIVPTICLSAEYRLLHGRNEEVCKAYLRNLNSFKDWPDMACNRDFSENIPSLKGIEWQPTWTQDKKQNKAVIINKDVWDKILTFTDPINYAGRKKYDFLGYSIREAKIDIDNDGVLESVYRIEKFLCRASKTWATYLVVFDKDKNNIDMERTNKVLAGAITDKVLSDGVMFDAFTYEGRTYFDMWDDRGFAKDPKTLAVYLFKNDRVQKACVFRYRKE
ncbi:MAG: hypothetical protein KA801_12080 [Syntrophorhabdaceae bacterium]|nr:hypothetical protein [Syntrophorhabdaceae bacterium]